MEEKQRDFKFYIIIFQIIFSLIIICSALVIKFVGGDFYSLIRQTYVEYFEQDTTLDDLLGPAMNYSDFEEGYSVYSE